jgi:cytosine/adenosine deaminase-related metal-dependent hydrolase
MKNKKLIIAQAIVTNNQNDEILRDKAVLVENGFISKIIEQNEISSYPDYEKFDFGNHVLIPGFVQTHIHLCQTLFRGLADDLELLDWLQLRIFPFENAHNAKSLRFSAQLGIHELQTSGTTTLLDMGTVNHQEVIFDELIRSKMRAIAGKCMMDYNDLYPSFKKSTREELDYTVSLAEEFHDINGKIRYGFAPRFVLSCTEELLIETKQIMKDFPGSIYHTHSSENKSEVEEVRRRFGKENIEYFNSIGVLDDHTVLAHCIHVNDSEIKTMKKQNSRVSHCPSSNLKLGSGIANIPKYLSEGINVSLGADGAPCNNNLSVFNEMRLAALIQKPIHGPTFMDAKTVFKLATIEGAKALHLENEIGSIEVGKKADIVLLNLEKANQSVLSNDENIYSNIVYSASKENVSSVFIQGDQVVNNGKSLIYDEGEIISSSKVELKKLMERAV